MSRIKKISGEYASLFRELDDKLLVKSNNNRLESIRDAHNNERAPLGIPNLVWSDDLADDALSWAGNLARRNSLRHSSNRRHIGENIARRKSRSDSLELLLDAWASEKKYYQHKPYPRCSRTGDKGDVGHYTQMIWEETTEVGCGFARGFGRDYLVCQYKTSGNRDGKYAYDKNLEVDTPVVQTPVVNQTTVNQTIVNQTVVQPPVVKTPVVQTPVKETPVVQTPVKTTPVKETPVKETSSDPFIKQCLDTHNAERTPLGIQKLTWSEDLAKVALSWAKNLANKGSLSHSSGRVHIGENVSYTGTKTNSLARLLDMWMSEKQYYQHKPYPNCSNTGDKGDVGHYTQVIWRDTTEVGCGLATQNGKDFLVCQYKTSGNRQGKLAY